LTDVSREVPPRHLQTHAILSSNSKMFFSIVLRKPVQNLYAWNFARDINVCGKRQCTSAMEWFYRVQYDP